MERYKPFSKLIVAKGIGIKRRDYVIQLFKLISDFFGLNRLKERMLRLDEQGLTEEEIVDLNRTKPQNPFGLICLFAGFASFISGLTLSLIIIPISTLMFCCLTFGTFDKDKEDNPWTFYLGFCLTLMGLIINCLRIHIHIIV